MPTQGLQLGAVAFRPISDPHARRRFHEGPVMLRPEKKVGPLFTLWADTTTRLAGIFTGRRAAWPVVSVVTHTLVITLILFVLPLTGTAVRPAVPQPFPYLIVRARLPAPPPPPPAAPADEPAPEEPAPEAVAPVALDEIRSKVAPVSPTLTGTPIAAATGIRPETGLVPGRRVFTGGVRGGVVGGVVGGLSREVPPPPPEPLRVGGPIPTPELLHRVEPDYPNAAKLVGLQGVVILEATVDEQGRVRDAFVLRSATKLLDQAALDAVRQWRYEPLLFHGQPSPFRLTVTVSFSLER